MTLRQIMILRERYDVDKRHYAEEGHDQMERHNAEDSRGKIFC